MTEANRISLQQIYKGETRYWMYDPLRDHERWVTKPSLHLPIARAFFVDSPNKSSKSPLVIEVFARRDLSPFVIEANTAYFISRYKQGEVTSWEQQVPIILCSDIVETTPFNAYWIWCLLYPDFDIDP